MNKLRKFLFGQGGGCRLKPLCQQCVQNGFSSLEAAGMNDVAHNFWAQRLNVRLKLITKSFCQKMDILSEVLSKQCNVVIAQRIRRTYQIMLLYRNLYGERLLKEHVGTQLNRIKKRPLAAVLSACIFCWDKERVTDEEIHRAQREVDAVHKLVNCQEANSKWEQIVDTDEFKVWRSQIANSQLYEYRVLGHFKDIPARAFFNTQVDVGYWKDWDKQTIDVKIVDKDDKTDSEVIQWLYKFPYPMYPREYVYVRRCVVDKDTKTMVITARSTEHPDCPINDANVRIKTYTSRMVISPIKSFDENGFTYMMSYCDDPQTNFPPMCYNWMASSGVQDFLERMHRATLNKYVKPVDLTTNIMEHNPPLYSGMAHQ